MISEIYGSDCVCFGVLIVVVFISEGVVMMMCGIFVSGSVIMCGLLIGFICIV